MSNHCEYLEIEIPMPWGIIAGCWYGDTRIRPLLAIHGWQDNAGTYARLAPLLTTHASILAIDLTGHGRSSHLPPGIRYQTFDYVQVIRRIILHYGWSKVSLMGHSMGACVSFLFAALFPHLVDMIIAFDALSTRYFSPDMQIYILEVLMEKSISANPVVSTKQNDPPVYTFDELELLLHVNSEESVDLDKCKYILERSIRMAPHQPGKFYFGRDHRVKYMFEALTEPNLTIEMAKRIRNINYIVFKGEQSHYIDLSESREVLNILRRNNPRFEFYRVKDGKHHLHLNQAELIADYIRDYLDKYWKAEIIDSPSPPLRCEAKL